MLIAVSVSVFVVNITAHVMDNNIACVVNSKLLIHVGPLSILARPGDTDAAVETYSHIGVFGLLRVSCGYPL